MCAYNNSDSRESYCFGYQEGVNYSSKNKDQANQMFNSIGFSDLKNSRFNNVSINYSYRDIDNGYKELVIYYNKGPNLIMAAVTIKASDINDESLSTFTNILLTYK